MNRLGFTFIELMVVIGLIVVTMGLSYPALKNRFYSLQKSNFSHHFAAVMKHARITSIREGKIITLTYVEETHVIALDTMEEDQKIRIRSLKIPEHVEISCDPFNLQFYPNGSITETKCHIKSPESPSYEVTTHFSTGLVSIDEKI